MTISVAPFFIILVQFSTIIFKAASSPKFPAILIFGDSTVDTGNNDYIATVFKGNHYPYGKDFPGHFPTGRFSNGKLAPDIMANMTGIKENVPPFLDPNLSNYDLRTGVSFASAGSGYDDITGAAAGIIPVSKQLRFFKNYIERLKGFLGKEESMKIINSALVFISAATNDFGFNFYDIPTRRQQFTIDGYQDFLQGKIKDIVEELYNLGCRKIVVSGLPPVGCLPIQITSRFKNPIERTCLQDQNSDAQVYNQKLSNLLHQLQSSLPGSKIMYGDVYEPVNDMINNPHKYGFVVTNRGCCGTGFVETGSFCNIKTPTCADASQFLFWDCIHPTEAAYKYISKYLADRILSSLEKD